MCKICKKATAIIVMVVLVLNLGLNFGTIKVKAATAYGANLVVNGDGELSGMITDPMGSTDYAGWNSTSLESGGTTAFVVGNNAIFGTIPSPNGGNIFDYWPNAATSDTLYQTIDISDIATDVDNGNVVCNLRGYLAKLRAASSATIVLEMLNSSDQVLSSHVLTEDSMDYSDKWVYKSLSHIPVNVNTRTLKISLNASISDVQPIGDFIEFDGIEVSLYQVPVINVKGNNTNIANGDITPVITDDTNFGSADISTGSVTNTFTIENNGATNLLLYGAKKVLISGMNASDFTVTTQPSSPVAVGGTTTFDITFNPSAVGVRYAKIIIENNTFQDPFEFHIAGTGTEIVPAYITAASVQITAPVLGVDPQNAEAVQAATNHADFTVTDLIWNEPLTTEVKFKAGKVYTATVTLTSKNGKKFQSAAFTPTVAGSESVGSTITSGEAVGNTVSFTVRYATTGALTVSSIVVTTQPTKMNYTETTDGVLALNGMKITETNNDGSIKIVTFTDGTAADYTSTPANGTVLTNATHNGHPVTITHIASSKTANTNNLTVVDYPTISINDVSMTEGNAGAGTMTFTVTLSKVSENTVTVDYATANGTAIAGNDYTATSGKLTFDLGKTTKTITVPIYGDTNIEADETFYINLSNVSGATISDNQGIGTILNDDLAAAPVNGSISPTMANFNLNPSDANHKAIAAVLTNGDYSLSAIKNGTTTLSSGTDYTFNGEGIYTLTTTYLQTLSVGVATITFDMDDGIDPTLTLTLSDTRTVLTAVDVRNTTPKFGDALSATIVPSSATVSYSWQVDGTEVGTSTTYTVKADDIGKTITVSVTGIGAYKGTVTSAAFVKTTPTALDLIYNLTAVNYDDSAKPVSVTAGSDKTLGDITVKYNGSTTAPINAGTYVVTVDIAGNAEYNATTELSLGNYIIKKIAYTGTTTVSASVLVSGQTGTTVTLPTLPAGANYGTPVAGGTIMMTGISITDTTLTYTSPASTAGQTGTMTIPVTGATNYEDYSIVVTVTFTAKTPQVISYATATIAKTYGDAKFTNSLTQTTANGTITYASDDTSVATVNSTTGEVSIIAVGDGSATITATAAETSTHAQATASHTVTVAKKALTLKAEDKNMTKGDGLPSFTYTATGLVNGDAVTTPPTMSTTADGTAVGSFDITIVDGVVTNVASYNITRRKGTLTVAEQLFTVTVTNGTGGGNYAEGATVTIRANDRSGYTFTGWSGADVTFADASKKTTTFIMPAKAATVTANYRQNSSGGDGGGNTSSPTTTPDPDKIDKSEGQVEKEQQQNAGAPAVNVNNSSDELKSRVFTAAEQEMVAKGENAKVILKVTDISASVSDEEKALIQEQLSSKKGVASQSVLYVDLSLFKQVGSREETRITETNGKIRISVEVPDKFWNMDVTKSRAFYVVRIHDKEVTRIDGSYDPVTHLFTFETDQFSTYALTYQDSSIQTYQDFYHLQLTAKANKTSQTLSYKKAVNVDGYLIYGAVCGKEMKKLAEVPVDTVSYTVKNLKQGTYYKYQVKAYRIIDGEPVIIMTSKVVHSVTESKTYANPTKITLNVASVKLAVGKTKTLSGQVVLPKGKKGKEHTAAIRYESTNKKVATVNSKGKITAKAKGICYVYTYAQNGVYKRIKVTVE